MRIKCTAAGLVVVAALIPVGVHAQIAITSVTQTPRFDDGRMHFAIAGRFQDSANVRSEIICNGRPTPSAVDNASASAIHVNLPVQRGNTRCTFRVYRLIDGARSALSASAELALVAPLDEISGSRDRGTNGNRHLVELYGRFPNYARLVATYGVACAGAPAANVTIDYRTAGQLNVSFNQMGDPRCTFVLGYTGADAGRRTNLWGPVNLRPNDALTGFGAYHWSTEVALDPGEDDTLASGQRQVTRAGFDVVRVAMTPEMRLGGTANRYKHNLDLFTTECPVNVPFLPCAARSNGYQRLFSSPGARIVMLTTGDSTSWGVNGTERFERGLDPAWWAPQNTANVVGEYRDLALALYETQQNTGKTFIIANWETDNQLACGRGPSEYVQNADLRRACERGPHPPWAVVQAFVKWFSARKQGVQQAAAIAAARGITGVTVADAIEFNSVRWFQNSTGCNGPGDAARLRCYNTLDDIVPAVNPAYVSWSAWESIRDDLPPASASIISTPGRTPRLDADLAMLKARFSGAPGVPQLIVGEFGIEFDPDLGLNPTAWAMGEIARAVQRAGLSVNVGWAAYDSRDDTGRVYPFGLFTPYGTEKVGMQVLRDALRAGAAELAQPHPGRIDGIVVSDVAVGSDWFDLFEIYGSFPTPPASASQVTLTCDGVRVTPEIVGSNTTQVNIRMRHLDLPQRYCSVKLPGTLTHGPKKMWPGTCTPPPGQNSCR